MMKVRARAVHQNWHAIHSGLGLLNLILQSTTTTTTNSVDLTRKRCFSVYDSYQKANKKRAKVSASTPAINFKDKMSAMIDDYIHEPVIDTPKVAFSKTPWSTGRTMSNAIVYEQHWLKYISLLLHPQLLLSLYSVMLESLTATEDDACWQRG